ncbi:hypothetical protein PRZ48_013174 [Zasmidium cellare]|uniref:Heterokaryon incompatibility domain-containing protein n=1 Tax=Zasmidium cellare TaxID=395010 RepID=A0ABR0E3V1_ZASCE|nr:hypothetical protein PRZ48_013174 [Zasmidium cellare]
MATTGAGDTTASLASTFGYTPLSNPRKEIRLLEILPSGDDGQMQCILGVHALDKVDGRFVAISYTWGEPGSQCEIVLDGRKHPVRQNCWYALWQMRLHDSSKGVLHQYYWIDSICINQNDFVEKSSQIHLMGQIYASAKLVAVCIGELAQDFIDLSWLQGSSQTYGPTGIGQPPVPSNPSRVATQLEAREYFSRLWVVQECYLADGITIFCGPHALPHGHWAATLGKGVYRNNRNPLNRTYEKLDLAVCVQRWSDRKCSDLHDKLYGFLSMADPLDRVCIRPDYSLPLWDMLQDYSAATVANAEPSNWSPKRLEIPAQSIAILTKELGTDAKFRESVRRFFLQRIQDAPDHDVPTIPSQRETFALDVVAIGKIHIVNSWRSETHGIRHDEVVQNVLTGPDPPKSRIGHTELRTMIRGMCHASAPQLAEEKTQKREDYGPPGPAHWRPRPRLLKRREARWHMLVPWNAREDDIVMQLTDLDNSFVVCREAGGVMRVIGPAVNRRTSGVHFAAFNTLAITVVVIIRLLEILPGPSSDQIRCKISTNDLAEVENEFIAISYTWGEPGSEEVIEIDGRTFLVRQNCRYALWQMRKHVSRGHRPSYYWIDSVCINQNDEDEKASQVRLMGQIFSQARYVAACIGDMDNAFRDLLSLPPYGSKIRPLGAATFLKQEEKHIRQRLRSRPYFKRLWVAQESILAKDITIFCGSKYLQFSRWEQGIDVSPSMVDKLLPRCDVYGSPALFQSISELSGRACQDLHDKIYALLALGTHEEINALSVDYSQALWDMLAEFSTEMASIVAARNVGPLILSITKLALQFSMDSAFVQDARRFVAQRITEIEDRPLSVPSPKSFVQMRGRVLGYIAEKVLRPIHCEGGHYLEDCPQQEKLEYPFMPWLYSNKGAKTRARQDDAFRLGRVTHNIWNTAQEDHIPWKAYYSLAEYPDAAPTEFLAPVDARPGDVVFQFAYMREKFLLCRKEGDESVKIVGNLVEISKENTWSASWLQGGRRCRRCGKSGCSEAWSVYMHTDDLLNLALLQDDQMALVCMPFTTARTGSYVELSQSCGQVK